MATPLVRLHSGTPAAIDYTPGSAVTAGDVVVQDDLIGVAPRDIAASAKGALQVVGPTSTWVFPKTAGTSTAIAAGNKVYWDASGEVATETASTHKILGKAALAATDAATSVYVIGLAQATS